MPESISTIVDRIKELVVGIGRVRARILTPLERFKKFPMDAPYLEAAQALPKLPADRKEELKKILRQADHLRQLEEGLRKLLEQARKW